jgi:hypothetical protein
MDTGGENSVRGCLEGFDFADGPTEIRTRVSAVRGQRPWPLDDGAGKSNGCRRSTVKHLDPSISLGDVSPLAPCGARQRRRDSGAGIRTPILRSRAACPACWTTPESSSSWMSSASRQRCYLWRSCEGSLSSPHEPRHAPHRNPSSSR